MARQQLSESYELILWKDVELYATVPDSGRESTCLWALHDDSGCNKPFLVYIRASTIDELHDARDSIFTAWSQGTCPHRLDPMEISISRNKEVSVSVELSEILSLSDDLVERKWFELPPAGHDGSGIAAISEEPRSFSHVQWNHGGAPIRRTATMETLSSDAGTELNDSCELNEWSLGNYYMLDGDLDEIGNGVMPIPEGGVTVVESEDGVFSEEAAD